MSELVLGIDLGGTNTKFGIITPDGAIVEKREWPTQADLGPDGVLRHIAACARELMGGHTIARIGMGVPGPMSSREGIVYEAPNLPGWVNTPVAAVLTAELGIPVALNNDANAAAWGEFWMGAGKEVDTMILFTLGTGVGGGIIINDELYTGPDDTAGELGHMVINFDGPVCGCGNRGCVEAYASATAIRRRVQEAVAAGRSTSIADAADLEDTKDVYDAAVAGDPLAIEVLRETGHALGIAAAAIINIFNPEMIAYGGALANAGEFIFTPLREAAHANAFAKPASRAQIVQATLGNDAGMIGAAGLALKRRPV